MALKNPNPEIAIRGSLLQDQQRKQLNYLVLKK